MHYFKLTFDLRPVRGPRQGHKYVIVGQIPLEKFLHSGVEVKRGVEFRHSTSNAF